MLTALLALAPAVALPGCLSPQDIELEETPTTPNEPPVIDELSVLPRGNACVSSTGESVVFSVQVSDANGQPPAKQHLTARWFVDYDLDSSAQSTTNDIVLSQDLAPLVAGETVAYPRAELPSGIIRGRLAQHPADAHTVEVVISDGFDDDPAGKPRNRTVKAGSYAAVYKWFVLYQQGGTCDAQ